MKTKHNCFFVFMGVHLLFLCDVAAQSHISQYQSVSKYVGKGYTAALDTAKLKITYSLHYVPDSLSSNRVMKDRKVLLIGDKIYHFFSDYIRQADSVLTADFDKGKVSAPIKRASDIQGEAFDLYINYPNVGKQTVIESIATLSVYQYEEPVQTLLWTIGQDTCTILNYPCQKATTYFRGREWEVWFCIAIPIDAGPWKLHGLPGLILKAADSKNHYVFECIGIEQLRKTKEPILMQIKYRNNCDFLKCTREEYRKAQKQFYDNYVNSLLAMGINIFVQDDAGNTVEKLFTPNKRYEERGAMWTTIIKASDRYRKIPYNPIELE